MCMCMCVWVYGRMCECCMGVYAYRVVYVCRCIGVSVYRCIGVCVYVCMCVCVYVYAGVYGCIRVRGCMGVWAHRHGRVAL